MSSRLYSMIIYIFKLIIDGHLLDFIASFNNEERKPLNGLLSKLSNYLNDKASCCEIL
jgi:hypothetical protein